MGHSTDLARVFILLCTFAGPLCAADKPTPPDTSRIIALINNGMAHACPIAPNYAVTARHVAVDDHPLRDRPKPEAYRGENSEWVGYLDSTAASDYEDAGLLQPETPFPSWYTLAVAAPVAGEQLWWVGFDWRKQAVAFAPRIFTAKVTRVVAGYIIMDGSTPRGSSGSCVLNARGEVVGIVSFGKDLENFTEAAGFVGLWAPWFRVPADVLKPEPPTAPPVPSTTTPAPTPQP